MSITTKKFSEFTNAGDLQNNEITVGLNGGVNSQFNNPWTFLAPGNTGDRPPITADIYYRLRFNTQTLSYEFYDPTQSQWVVLEDSQSVLPLLASHLHGEGASLIGLENQTGVTNKTVQDLANATLIAQTDNGTLTNGQFMDDLANGVMYNTGGVLGADPDFTTDGAGTVSISTQLSVANLRMNGNSISSTNTDGIIYLLPNGVGSIVTGTTATVNQLSNYTQSGLAYLSGSGLPTNNPTIVLIGLDGDNANEPSLALYSTESSSIGSYSALSDNSSLGSIGFFGDDGEDMILGSQIESIVSNTVSSGIMPSNLYFKTCNTAGVLNNSLIIDYNSNIFCFNNISSNNFLAGYNTTATSAGTTTLTVNSSYLQYFTGSTTQTVVMPVTSTLALGQAYRIVNNSSGALTINSSGGNLILTMAPDTSAILTCILITGTTAASWDFSYFSDSGSSGIVNPGTINQLAWYATSGSSVSGLSTANSGVLVTSSSGVPSISTTLPNNLAMGTPLSITLTNATGLPVSTGISGLGTGIATWLATPSSANLLSAMTTKTGSGNLVFGTSPTLVTPTLGAATATSLNFGGSTLQTYTVAMSFTPTITCGTPGDLSVSYSVQVGNYTKIGVLIFIEISLTFVPTYTTASGNLVISGLPFNSVLTNDCFSVSSTSSSMTWPVGRTQLTGITIGGTSQIIITAMGSAVSTSNVQMSAIPTTQTGSIILSGVYRTATA